MVETRIAEHGLPPVDIGQYIGALPPHHRTDVALRIAGCEPVVFQRLVDSRRIGRGIGHIGNPERGLHTEIVVDTGTQAVVAAAPGRNGDDTVGTPITVECQRCGVLQHGDVLHFLPIQAGRIAFDAVDQYDHTVPAERTDAAHIQVGRRVPRQVLALAHAKSRNQAVKVAHQVGTAARFDLTCRSAGERCRRGAFADALVIAHVEQHVIVRQTDMHLATADGYRAAHAVQKGQRHAVTLPGIDLGHAVGARNRHGGSPAAERHGNLAQRLVPCIGHIHLDALRLCQRANGSQEQQYD